MNKDKVRLENVIQYVGYSGNWSHYLVCTICGFEYVHPIAVRVTREKETTEVTGKGIFIHEAENPGRGVIIELEFVCENGHHGVMRFQFHKGSTFVGYRELPNLEGNWETIWRD